MLSYLFFFAGFSFILAHEMDAIRLKEWRMFLLLQDLNEDAAYVAFTALHIPLYVALFLALFGDGQSGLNRVLVITLDIFFIVHVMLHLLFLRHPHNQFKAWFSWTLILGAGIAGALDLVMRLWH